MWAIILLVIVTGLIICGVALVRSCRLTYELSHPKRARFELRLKFPVAHRSFEFRTEDGVLLKGIDLCGPTADKGCVLVCHHLGGTKEMAVTKVDFLIAAGYRVIGFDFRNHGESQTDRKMKFLYSKDFDAFFTAVKQSGVNGPFIIIGFSVGSNIALLGMEHHVEIKAAVLDSGPLVYCRDYFKYVLQLRKITDPVYRWIFIALNMYYAGFAKLSINTIRALQRLKGRPVLLIQGLKDHIIPAPNSETAYQYLQSGKVLWWRIPNAQHLTGHRIAKAEYREKLLQFCQEHLPEQVLVNE